MLQRVFSDGGRRDRHTGLNVVGQVGGSEAPRRRGVRGAGEGAESFPEEEEKGLCAEPGRATPSAASSHLGLCPEPAATGPGPEPGAKRPGHEGRSPAGPCVQAHGARWLSRPPWLCRCGLCVLTHPLTARHLSLQDPAMACPRALCRVRRRVRTVAEVAPGCCASGSCSSGPLSSARPGSPSSRGELDF